MKKRKNNTGRAFIFYFFYIRCDDRHTKDIKKQQQKKKGIDCAPSIVVVLRK